jgi:Fur family ferric uptake transcriptional regulator
MPHPVAEPKNLRRVGLKVTQQRIRILELLEQSEVKHLSAEDVYRQLLERGEDIGIATVYRVLNQFEAAGLVRRHHFEGGQALYELESGDHHDHMVCLDTGEVIEFESPEIEALQEQIAAKHGFVLEDHRLVLFVRKPRPARRIK